MRTTHTFATLAVSAAAFDEIAQKLRAADYDHAFVGDCIDMHGIALEREAVPEPSADVVMRYILERCRTVLGNMAMENEGAIFHRWPISHEPLRVDARGLLPLIDAVLKVKP